MHALMAPVASKLRQRRPRPGMGICGCACSGHRHDLFGAGAIPDADAHTNPDAQPEPYSCAHPVADGQHG
ncbi:hypothetical protein ACVJGD_001066 [Bradyrhizobium sp. USDA 10063]